MSGYALVPALCVAVLVLADWRPIVRAFYLAALGLLIRARIID